MKVTMFTWELDQGAFALGYAANAVGFHKLGVEEIHLLYLNRHSEAEVVAGFPPGVKFITLPARHSRDASLAVAQYLRQHQPDLMIAMPIHINLAAILGRMLAPKVRTKLIIGDVSMTSHLVDVEFAGQWSYRLLPTLERWLYPYASGVVCNNQDVVEDLTQTLRVKIPPERLTVIPPAIDVAGISQWKDEAVNHPWLKDKTMPVVVSVARLAIEKNLSLLINAFEQVHKQVGCRLLILGEGPEREKLQSLIDTKGLTQYVDLAGHVQNPWAYMSRCDLFVLTSVAEGFGRVLIEAMTCNLPVIATDAFGGGPRTILDGGRYGKLIPSNYLEMLVDSMLCVLLKPEVAQEMRERGAERVSLCEPVRVSKAFLDFAATLDK